MFTDIDITSTELVRERWNCVLKFFWVILSKICLYNDIQTKCHLGHILLNDIYIIYNNLHSSLAYIFKTTGPRLKDKRGGLLTDKEKAENIHINH